MDDLLLIVVGGIIAGVASIIGAIVGATLGSQYEAKTRWNNRPRPVINDIWFHFEECGNPHLEIKNIGLSTAKGITFEEVLFDKKQTLIRRDMWVTDNDGNGRNLNPMQLVDITWIYYDSVKKTLTFPINTGDKIFSLDEVSFPITGRITLFALDTESDYYEYRIRMMQGHPYIQKATNRNYAGPKYPESVFDDKL